MKRIFYLTIICLPALGFAQDFARSLNGFYLGQFREVPTLELQSLFQKDKFPDGFEYEIFLLEPDTSVYMIFEYASHALETIWSIQLTGTQKGFDCGFKGLTLGMDSLEIVNILGPAFSIEDAGRYGKKWSYLNYSLEINPNGFLAGIKLMDMSDKFFPKPDGNTVPTFEEYAEILGSEDRNQVANLLAPGLEIYFEDSVYYFRHSIRSEIETDKSEIFALIEKLNQIIAKTNTADSLQFGESLRVTTKRDVMAVSKFWQDGKYSEIVFKHFFGRFLIWEIKIQEKLGQLKK